MAKGVEIANAYVAIHAQLPGVKKAVESAISGVDPSRAAKPLGGKLGSAIAGATAGAVAAVTAKAVGMVANSIGSAVKRVDTMANFPKMMKNMGYSAKDAEKAIGKMSDRLTGLPTALDGMAGMVQQLAPLTGGLDKATELSLALNNAMLAGGKPAEIQANAMEQFSQMLAIGKPDIAAWRSMVTAMPGQMDQLAVSLLGAGNKGMDLYQSMKDGKTSFDDFNAAIVKLNTDGVGEFASFEKQARDATDGIGTGWSNLQTAITRNVATIIAKLKPVIDASIAGATQIANAMGPAVIAAIDWAQANQDWLVPALLTTLKVVGVGMAVWAGYRAVLAAIGFGKLIAGLVKSTTAWSVNTAAVVKDKFVTAQIRWLYAKDMVIALGATIKKLAVNTVAWVKNTAILLKNKAVQAVHNSGVVIGLKMLGMQAAAAWRSTVAWVKNTASLVASKVAMFATATAAKAAAIGQRLLNAAMNANPIGLVVTAIAGLVAGLTWFFTSTKTGQMLWAEFTRFLGEAWQNVLTAWEAVKTWFAGFWEGLKTVFSSAVDWVVNLFLNWTVYGLIIKNWGAIKTFFVNVWSAITGYVSKKITQIKTVISAVTAVIRNVWRKVWGGIKSFFTGIWAGLVNYLRGRINLFKSIFNVGVTFLRTVWSNVWNAIKSKISSVWSGVKSTLQTLIGFVKSKPKEAFQAARDAIGKAWSGIQDLAKKPVKFVVETVINGLIGAINKIPGVNVKKLALPKGFRVGGYTGNVGVDQAAGVVHGREFVTRAESTRKIMRNHPGVLEHMNRHGEIPGYRRGGWVDPLPRGSFSVSQAFGMQQSFGGTHNGIDLAAPLGTSILAPAPGVVGSTFVDSLGGNMVQLNHAGGWTTRYAHMAGFNVKAGQSVKAGNKLGSIGMTGLTTGPHLHYMVSQPPGGWSNVVDPASFLGSANRALPGGSVKSGGLLSGLFDGLAEKLFKKFETAFPGASMFINAAGGIMREAVSSVIDWGKSKIGIDTKSAKGAAGPTLYDSGGLLPVGTSLVENRSGRPEPILTGAQWDSIIGSRTGFSGKCVVRIGSRDFEGYIGELADDAVDRGFEDQAAAGRHA